MSEQNSISTLLPELLRLFNNSTESLEKVNAAITSSRDSVTVDLENQDGTVSRITIPSFGFLKNSIDRLDRNIDSITNVTGGGSSLRLSDGTFRKLILDKLPTEAEDLNELNSVQEFNIKSNWFFESLINPLLYVTFNLTGQVPIDTERAIVKRYILDLNTKAKVNYFDNSLKGRSDISYDQFLQDIVERNISYVLDEDTINLPPRDKRYSGKFSVIRISDTEITEEINGATVTTTKKLYKLNKITYSDSEAQFPDTIQLKVGDSLEVISSPVDTRYVVKQIDSSTNSVVLELVEGTRTISQGADILKVGSAVNDNVELDVAVGFDERCVTFVKPVDPDSKIPAVNWSPGSAFYTNELTTINTNGNEQSLSDYYQNNAIDFGRFLLSFAQDKFPTSKEGIKPGIPNITSDDLKVVEINKQLTGSPAIVQITDLNNQKNTLESELKELDNSISKKRTRIQTTNYTSEVDRDSDVSELRGLITERSSQAELYSSVVKQIAAIGNNSSVSSIGPKYRVRGFFELPKPKVSPATGAQEIVKTLVRYRYLSTDGAANEVNQFTFQDGEQNSSGAFSNWEIRESVLRKRVKNSITGNYEWASINTDDASESNINQIDIPIRKGEIVELQVKAVSEAGWPSNPMEGDWSQSVRVEFPANLSSDNSVTNILEQNQTDLAKVSLEEELNAKGINEHLSSSFTAQEKYFAHVANVIASGFLSENQTPVDLFSKLVEMQNRLDEYEEILKNARGELELVLVDDDGNVIQINREANTKVFAGYYSQEVQDLDDPRGAVITKTFFLNLSNSQQSTLQLISKIAGNRERMVIQSENPSFATADGQNGTTILPATYPWLDNSADNQSDSRPTYTSSDSDYNVIRKYDISPVSLTNPTVNTNNKFGQIKSLTPFQSSQNRNQFIYSRYKDISADETFYSYINPDGYFVINLDTAENYYGRTSSSVAVDGEQFIWGGGFDSSGNPTTSISYQSNNDDILEVHVEHPWVQSYAAYRQAYIDMTGDSSTLPALVGSGVDCVANGTAAVLFRQSKFAPIKSDQDKGKKQSIYLNEDFDQLNGLPGTDNGNDANTYPSGGAGDMTAPSGSQTFQASPTIANVSNLSTYSRNVKSSFNSFDQFMLGKKSVGSYLFVGVEDHDKIQVSGDSIQSVRNIQFGNANSINIPIIFQFRMTDYFGSGSGVDGGLGNIGGDTTGSTTNLTYSKKIGIDIYPNGKNVVQFDLEFFAKYRSDNVNIDLFPSASVARGLNDLEKVVSNLSPSIKETKVADAVKRTGNETNSGFTGLTRNGG